ITEQDFFVVTSSLVQGYVEIKSDGPHLTGSVVFGDPGRSRYSSSLPLVSSSNLAADLVFGQVASGMVGGVPYYTGAALLNPGSTNAPGTVQVFNSDGSLLRTKAITVPANRRIVDVLTGPQFFPDLAGGSIGSGYIRVTLSQPVAGFALFG